MHEAWVVATQQPFFRAVQASSRSRLVPRRQRGDVHLHRRSCQPAEVLSATSFPPRAGETGKGLAVVAGEVKELVRQTATAAEQITGWIHAPQTDAGAAVGAIGQITEVIGRIHALRAAGCGRGSSGSHHGGGGPERGDDGRGLTRGQRVERAGRLPRPAPHLSCRGLERPAVGRRMGQRRCSPRSPARHGQADTGPGDHGVLYASRSPRNPCPSCHHH
ncbi:methyl-accepting chemotaxis protein [Kineococcus sp. SYSU DK005]|uniref:methyl-accepting chemotaxis protein n=1 Tax=Kineococcus sp. SYSU DK005 TaxID=3383126 RepID=UPI003D7CA4A1